MAHLSNIYVKTETLQTLLDTAKSKGLKGISITLTTNDTPDNYGNNVSAAITQSKEEREARKKKFYVGNGKVFWNDNKIVNAPKQEQQPQNSNSYYNPNPAAADNLPF